MLKKRAPGTYPPDRCGPTLIISIGVMVLLAFLALYVLPGRDKHATRKPVAHPLNSEHLVR